ncbi:hypothetical protein VPH35_116954 [Triticum aestivum]
MVRHAKSRDDGRQEVHREGRPPPASPRTTSEDIIEIHPTSLPPGWPRLAAPCFGAKDFHSASLTRSPRPAPPPASCCQFHEDQDEPATLVISPTRDIIVMPTLRPAARRLPRSLCRGRPPPPHRGRLLPGERRLALGPRCRPLPSSTTSRPQPLLTPAELKTQRH